MNPINPDSLERRIVVIGESCSGKTTMATRLSNAFKIKHVELDALFWEPNWKEAKDEVFKARVTEELKAGSWVVDGNYTSLVRDIVWPMADTIVWLNPPLHKILYRLFIRSFARSWKGERLWGHSRETLANSLFSRNSLLVWILKTHARREKECARLLEKLPPSVRVFRLKTSDQIRDFLKEIPIQ